jgi:hypothetical protein
MREGERVWGRIQEGRERVKQNGFLRGLRIRCWKFWVLLMYCYLSFKSFFDKHFWMRVGWFAIYPFSSYLMIIFIFHDILNRWWGVKGNEAEASWLTRSFVCHDYRFLNLSKFREKLLELRLWDVLWKTTNKYFSGLFRWIFSV